VRACEASRVPTCLAIADHWLAPNMATASRYRLRSSGFHFPLLVDPHTRVSWPAPAPQLHASDSLRAAVNAAAARLARPGASAVGVSSVSTGLPAAELEPSRAPLGAATKAAADGVSDAASAAAAVPTAVCASFLGDCAQSCIQFRCSRE
jgi:hypothetical protein